MEEIVLIYPKTGMDEFARQPLSVLTVAGACEKAGFRVRVVDARTSENPEKEVRGAGKSSSAVGISAMTGYQVRYALRYAAIVRKENPNLPIVWGGVHPSLLPEQTLQSQFVDYIVKGEGEASFVELLSALENGREPKDVPGVAYSSGKKVIINRDRPFLCMDDAPMIPWHLVDMKKYVTVGGKPIIPLQTSRGCPFRCFYCYNTMFNMRKWRAMSVERTIAEVDNAVEKYKIGGMVFWDDNFFVDRKRAEGICRGLLSRDLDWEADIRPDLLSSFSGQFLSLLRKSGCSGLFIGAESGCQEILNLIKKDTKVGQIVKSVELCGKHGISPILSFMIGFPTETPGQWKETMAFMNKLKNINKDSQLSLSIFAPFPGTESFDFSIGHGFVPPDSLAGWSDFITSTAENRQWLSGKQKRLLEDLAFISRLAFQFERMEEFIKNPLFRLALRTLHRIEKFRWENEIWSFPLEVRIANRIYARRS